MTEPLLAAEAIGKSFGRRPILQTAGVWATAGRITALLGRNGAGKSTLLKITVGLLKADRGVVIYKSTRRNRPKLHTLARDGLYYLPQEGVLSRWFSVGTHLRAVANVAQRPTLDEAVERLDLAGLLHRPVIKLSGGERRRAELGLVLVRQPDCLLADEPFIDLAPKARTNLGVELRRLAAAGCAIIVTGHEVDALLEFADDVVWMTDGTTHALGSPAQALAHHQFRREYLGGLMSDPTGRC